MIARILVFTRTPALTQRLTGILESNAGDRVVTETRGLRQVWSSLKRESFDLLVSTTSDLPHPVAETVRAIRAAPDAPEVVLLTQEEDAEERIRLTAAGALDVLWRNLPDRALRGAFDALIRRRRAHVQRSAEGDDQEFRFGDFASSSPAMDELLSLAERVARSDASLLVLGETGVGKEWLAHAIHTESARADGPFVAVNCSALPDTLLESELFGHVEGAFTGAVRARRGYFELAHEGTLFLDEIGDMPLALQAKLLRALQERRIQPLGSERSIPVDVRIMAATNRNLEEAMEAGEFRPDLYFRLGVVTLTVPPLRERREDIPELVNAYCERFSDQFGRDLAGTDPAAMEALERYAWPGNVRELINVMERAVLLAPGPMLSLPDLPAQITGALPPEMRGPEPPRLESLVRQPLSEARDRVVSWLESAYLERLLSETRGRVGVAAERAGLSPRTLYNKMQEYGLDKADFRG
ncbi:MAG: sigma-54 dependent transcriptional regulator [Gemmatimonadota bacterium]|nr:sigma-54-dependent Fis family transcriptional regulator [Gemmatimonadota bacterium]